MVNRKYAEFLGMQVYWKYNNKKRNWFLSTRSYRKTKQSKFRGIEFNSYIVVESEIANKQRDNAILGKFITF